MLRRIYSRYSPFQNNKITDDWFGNRPTMMLLKVKPPQLCLALCKPVGPMLYTGHPGPISTYPKKITKATPQRLDDFATFFFHTSALDSMVTIWL